MAPIQVPRHLSPVVHLGLHPSWGQSKTHGRTIELAYRTTRHRFAAHTDQPPAQLQLSSGVIVLPDGSNSLMGGVDRDEENKEEEDYGNTTGRENSQASLEVQPHAVKWVGGSPYGHEPFILCNNDSIV